MVRQERIGIHMADAISRVTSGRSIGAFCMQHGPGAENAMGGVAQCYGELVPVLVLPMGYARRLANIEPNFNSSRAMRAFAKSSEPINIAAEVCNIFRRAFTKLKNGRGGPVIVEIPADMWNEEVPEPLNYTPVLRTRYGADPVHIKEAAALLVAAQTAGDLRRPGRALRQGLAAAERLAERLAIPVTTSLGGKIVVSRDSPAVARLGRSRRAARSAEIPREADVIFGIGCSFTETAFGIAMPKGKHHHPFDARSDPPQQGRRGDRPDRRRRLVLDALLEEIDKTVNAAIATRLRSPPRSRPRQRVAGEMAAETHRQRRAAESVSGAVGPAAHRRRGQHHHHP